jgi:hypothetical protein
MYSRELIQVIRWALQIDPLERPQSVFALQKALREPVAEQKKPALLGRVSGRLRGLFDGIGKGARAVANTIHHNTR